MPFILAVFLMPLPDAGEGCNHCSSGPPLPALFPNTVIMRTLRAPSSPTSSSHPIGDVAALCSHLPSLRCGVFCLSVLLLPPNSSPPRANAAVCLHYNSHSTVLSLRPSPGSSREPALQHQSHQCSQTTLPIWAGFGWDRVNFLHHS